MREEKRLALRNKKIKARDSLSIEDRKRLPQNIAERILKSKEFRNAKNAMIYCGIRGEVGLNFIEKAKDSEGKQFLFPLCLPERQMAALAFEL